MVAQDSGSGRPRIFRILFDIPVLPLILPFEFDGCTNPRETARAFSSAFSLGLLVRDPEELLEARRSLEKAITVHQAVLKARPSDQITRQFLRQDYQALVEVLVRLREPEKAAEAAAALAQEPPPGWEEAYLAAGFVARCIPLVEKGAPLPEGKRSEWARNLGDQALALLRQAIARGLTEGAGLRKDEAFAPVRPREDLQRLLAELEKKAQAGPP